MTTYEVKISIDDINIVEGTEDKIEEIKKNLKENISKTFLLRVVHGIGEIKIEFNKK